MPTPPDPARAATPDAPRFDPARSYTYGETLSPAMEVKTAEEAQSYADDLIAWQVARHGLTPERARAVVLESIGYWSGYWDRQTAERVRALFKTTHPIFGESRPTPEEAFAAGADAMLSRRAGQAEAEKEQPQ